MSELFSYNQNRRRESGEDRLPPGQRVTEDWPVLTYGATPEIDTTSWQLRIWGEVENEATLQWGDLLDLGLVERINDVHCVTTWSRYDNTWQGVLIATILEQARPKTDAVGIMFHSYGGYTTNVPLEDIYQDDHAMLAIQHDGKPITPSHGGPVRGVIPSLYFWKSAKWVNGMELITQDRPGFWEMYGYHIHGDPWTEERYS